MMANDDTVGNSVHAILLIPSASIVCNWFLYFNM